MRRQKLPKDTIVYSTVTQIFYKMEKDQLMKFCTYPGAERGWQPSIYSMGFNHMKPATKQQMKELK